MSETDPIIIVPYDSRWPEAFILEQKRIKALLGAEVRIEHIGSTSVANLCAKPIIDIMIGIESLDNAKKYIRALEKLDYTYVPEYEAELPERRYFEKKGFHIHMVEFDRDFWKSHIFFRDFLRTHTDLAREYCKLKKRLAIAHTNEREKYTKAKEPFIQKVLKNMYRKGESSK
ncbi:hypothetical protein AT15_03855 [Kosmotoga arenicorallina S304]|uniref:GrpB family protein n=1 Tax=Kosmotoga arenicorallina S304 TaxID=1453497 RepID=A0A176JYV3_9BACT|nr:GrpB family protein [Kosmotoga arenicorallina]OAA29133.1 hypothetical protein AT15_03855 [Kosmotoga arenicorallina S304]